MYNLIRPLLFSLDPELAHNLTHSALRCAQCTDVGLDLLNSSFRYTSSRLEQNLWGLEFSNPLGLAAGFDKNARVADAMSALGFGFLELGSVTLRSSEGNDRPRLFRLPKDEALINRMGLNNEGVYKFLSNYHGIRTQVPKIINISKTNDPALLGDAAKKDFVDSYRILGGSASIVVINLSCPNTKDGKTYEHPDILKPLLESLLEVREVEDFDHPLLVKFSSDIDADLLTSSIELCLSLGIAGFVLCNTSNSRQDLATDSASIERIGKGGLSGRPIFERSLERVRLAYSAAGGKVPIIGLGGVSSADDCIRMIDAGASLVEIYSALVFQGPGIVREILHGVDRYLTSQDALCISEVRGKQQYKTA